MSSRPLIKHYPVIVDGDLSLALTSEVTIIDQLPMLSYAYSWVGTTPIGNIVVEVSNDYRQNPDGSAKVPGTWNQIPLNATTAISGNTGNGMIDIVGIAVFAIRTRYTPVSGTGRVQVTVTSKVS